MESVFTNKLVPFVSSDQLYVRFVFAESLDKELLLTSPIILLPVQVLSSSKKSAVGVGFM